MIGIRIEQLVDHRLARDADKKRIVRERRLERWDIAKKLIKLEDELAVDIRGYL